MSHASEPSLPSQQGTSTLTNLINSQNRIFGPKIYVKDRTVNVKEIKNYEDKRNQLLDQIDKGNFQELVVLNGALGFFAGAYQIFAASLTLPIIELVYYYPGQIPPNQMVLLRIAILLGIFLGQLGFGLLADLYGRKHVYGYELLVLIVSAIGIVMSSGGVDNSMSFFGWLFAWRLMMGIGIGGDYPLSAILASEFAASRHRARMIAWVFYAQPLGYLFAALMMLAVISSHKSSLPQSYTDRACDANCVRALDRSWRLIVGLGAIFAFIGVYFRRKIPESPWYTADVLYRPEDATADVKSLLGTSDDTTTPAGNVPPAQTTVREDGPSAPITAPENGPSDRNTSVVNADQTTTLENRPPIESASNPVDEAKAQTFSYRLTTHSQSFYDHFIKNGHWPKLLGVAVAWCMLDTAYYALLGPSSTSISYQIFNYLPPFYNCTTSGCPPLQDTPNGPHPQAIYNSLIATTWRVIAILCAGSIPGGLVMIWLVKYFSPRLLQMVGFALLFVITLAAGLILRFVNQPGTTTGTVMMYILASAFFEIGPNFTTFMLPAQIFPTSVRASSHGIAAASGKLGAILFQVFVQFATFHDADGWHTFHDTDTKWLGYAIICFMPSMLVGLIVTGLLVPETKLSDGLNQPLDVLQNLPVPIIECLENNTGKYGSVSSQAGRPRISLLRGRSAKSSNSSRGNPRRSNTTAVQDHEMAVRG